MSAIYLSFENNVRKGEIAHNEQFLLSHSVFYSFVELGAMVPFPSNLKLSSANTSGLEESKICSFGKFQVDEKILDILKNEMDNALPIKT